MPPQSTRRSDALARLVVGAGAPLPPLRPLRYPVVLLHGFGAMANVGRGGIFSSEVAHLRMRGIWAYAPQTNPYDTLDTRVQTWAKHLEDVLRETSCEKVNLIGFSTGGLDARLLARDPAWLGRIASLVTVSTPHRGTALAEYVLGSPSRLKSVVLGLMDFAGRAAYENAAPNAADAIAELTPDAVRSRFDPDETFEGVFCGSFAARAGRGTEIAIFPPLVLPNRILFRLSGLNDGIVPTEGAWWAERLGLLDADHARQIGLEVSESAAFQSRSFYERLCGDLRNRGY